MQVDLIEAGKYLILFVREQKNYFLLNSHVDYFVEFASGEIDCREWKGGISLLIDDHPFTDNRKEIPKKCVSGKNISEDDIFQLFCSQQQNVGAVIASRLSTETEPKIFQRRRYEQIKSLYFNAL